MEIINPGLIFGDLNVKLESCAGALELWELAEDERLLVNRFTKHDHDHIVTTVSPISGSSSVVTGSMDCR